MRGKDRPTKKNFFGLKERGTNVRDLGGAKLVYRRKIGERYLARIVEGNRGRGVPVQILTITSKSIL